MNKVASPHYKEQLNTLQCEGVAQAFNLTCPRCKKVIRLALNPASKKLRAMISGIGQERVVDNLLRRQIEAKHTP